MSDATTVWMRRADMLSRRTPRSLLILTRDAPEPLKLEGAAIDVWDGLEQPARDADLVRFLAERFPGVDDLPTAVVETLGALDRYGAIVAADG